jgi:hypothetical protein
MLGSYIHNEFRVCWRIYSMSVTSSSIEDVATINFVGDVFEMLLRL